MGWFKQPPALPEKVFEHVPPKVKLKYPMWTFARVKGTDEYFLLLDKTKMPFISERAFLSWGRPYVIVSHESIAGYMKYKPIGFAAGTILISQADKTEWYITGRDVLVPERRRISTPDFYTVLGFDLDDAYMVSLPEIDFHKKGEDIVGVNL
jgi:hypothetical protein